MRILIPVLLFVCILAASAVTLPGVAEVEDSDCAMCHEEVVAAFDRTAHSDCQSCHGPGAEHIEEGGDPEKILRLQLMSPEDSSGQCLTCHQRQEKHFSARQSIHRLGEVGCVDCHNPHLETRGMIRTEGVELCSQCHPAVAARFGMRRSHPMGEGGPGCVSCHEPHASRREHLSRTSLDEACGRCHFEKTGPFLYGHDTMMVDGCLSCHEIHGSTGRHLLVEDTQVNLCYGCHGAGVTPGWHSTRRFLDEKCTACHTAIHGSNTSQFFLEE